MPLSKNPKDLHAWIAEEEKTKPRKQAIAIGLSHLREVKGLPPRKR